MAQPPRDHAFVKTAKPKAAGTLLLREIMHQYGVDVAAEDITLDTLA